MTKRKPTKRKAATQRGGKTTKSRAAKPSKKTALALTPSQTLPTVSTGAAAIAEANPSAAWWVALFGAVGTALAIGATLALDALRPTAQAFGDRLAKQVAKEGAGEPRKQLKAKLESAPSAQRATLEGVRRLLDSISPEVAEPLADLTAEYVNENKIPDGFFRGSARLLADLTSDEYDDLALQDMNGAPRKPRE